MSSDFFQISLQHCLFRSVFLWLHFILPFFFCDNFWAFAFRFSLIFFPSQFSLSSLVPHLLASLRSVSYPPSRSLLPSPAFASSFFLFFTSVFRSQRGPAVQRTVALVQFVAWPLVTEELQSSGPPAVQKAPPDEHCTRCPPQEHTRTVSVPATSLHPMMKEQSNFLISLNVMFGFFCCVSSSLVVGVISMCLWSQVLRLLRCRAPLTAWRDTDKLQTLSKTTNSVKLYTYQLSMHCRWNIANSFVSFCLFGTKCDFFSPYKSISKQVQCFFYIFVVKKNISGLKM